MSKIYYPLILIFFLLSACKKDKEERIRRSYSLDEFDTIQLHNSFDVFLIEDSVFSVEAEGSKSDLDKLEIAVENKTLNIKNLKKLKWTSPKGNPIALYIKSKPLKEVHANETCDIRTINPISSDEFGLILKSKANTADLQLNGNIFYYWNNFPCGGKLTLSGQVNELKIWNTAIMSVDAQNLITNYALVENNSQGVCKVNVLNRLDYKIDGLGDIHLYGSPPEIIQKPSSSSGRLIVF